MIADPDAFFFDCALRLSAAAACGLMLGLNRDLKHKPIGMRTLGLVALGAALVALSAVQDPEIRMNPDALSRAVQGVLQGVMTGVGFIGAGAILKVPRDAAIYGLTTAAAVWVTAALGVACALADWRMIAAGLILTLAVLIVPRRIAKLLGFDPEH